MTDIYSRGELWTKVKQVVAGQLAQRLEMQILERIGFVGVLFEFA